MTTEPMFKNYDSVIESLTIIIGNLEENLKDLHATLDRSMTGYYPFVKERVESDIIL